MKLSNLFLKSIVTVAVAFLFGALTASAAGFSEHAVAAGAVTATLCFIPQGNQMAGCLFTITAADIVSEWGAYYINQGQNVNDLVSVLMQKTETSDWFPTIPTENTVLRKAQTSFARVLQRFQKGFTPVGGITFEPKTIQLYNLKIDLQETADDITQSWLSFLEDSSLKRQDWPIIKYYLENAIKQSKSDMEKNEIYAGVTGAITPGTATAAGASLVGIKKLINTIDGAGTGDKQTLGAVPTDPSDFVDYVEAFIEGVDEILRDELDAIFMSKVLRNRYRDGIRIKYNQYYNQVDDNAITTLRNYPIKVVGLASHAGATKIWSTPKWNRARGLKKGGNANIFEVENVDRTVKAYTDWYEGIGFWLEQYVVYNDVELT